jgi:tRNA(Ile)-lysidine synthase TilS/MesJ
MKVYKKEIEDYCVENSLSIEKVFSSGMCYNDEYVSLQEPHQLRDGWENSMIGYPPDPVPNTLEIYLENGKLRFVQTELTYECLSDHHASKVAFA